MRNGSKSETVRFALATGVVASVVASVLWAAPKVGIQQPASQQPVVESGVRQQTTLVPVLADPPGPPSGGSGVWGGEPGEPYWTYVDDMVPGEPPPLVQSDPPEPALFVTPPPSLGITGVHASSPAPPDTHIAVGAGIGAAGVVVEVTNNSVQIWDKNGATVAGPLPLDTMFGANVFDPKVIFDQHSGRFFIVCLQGTTSAFSRIHLAISSSGTPGNLTSDWTFLFGSGVQVINGVSTWADYPCIGADSDSLFVTTNQFDDSSPAAFQASNIRVFDKAQLLAGSYTFVDLQRDRFTIQPCHVYGTTDNGGFYLVTRIGNSNVRLYNITGDPGAPVITSATHPWATGDNRNQARQLGSNVRLDTLTGRIMNAVYQGGHIYLCLTENVDADDPAEAVWLDVASGGGPGAATLFQGGFINGSGTDPWTYMPSINVNAAGVVAICYTQSSTSQFPSMYYAIREPADPLGTFQAPVQALPGPGYYHSFVVNACTVDGDCPPGVTCGGDGWCNTIDRWGDYSATVVDPTTDCFWVANEYAFTSSAANSQWGTHIARFCVNNQPPSAVCVPGPIIIDADPNCCVTVTTDQIDDDSSDPEGHVLSLCLTAVDGVPVGCEQSVYVCGTGDHTVTLTITDDVGQSDSCDATVTVRDVTPPTITCSATGGDVDANCEYEMPVTATIKDNCCIVGGGTLHGLVSIPTGNANFAIGPSTVTVVSPKEIRVDGTIIVSALTSCPATVRIVWIGGDCSGNAATNCIAEADVYDRLPPQITCPPDAFFERGDGICNYAAIQDWLNSATATDNCDQDVTIHYDGVPACGFPPGSTTLVTWTATDDCGNTATCSATVTIAEAGRGATARKGSVLIFPDFEVRWDAAGKLKQDTFISLNNDYGDDVHVVLYYVSEQCGRLYNDFTLTRNEPAYWSVASGQPKGVVPIDVFTPYPDPAGGTDLIVRGYLVVIAADELNQEIRWNHLYGAATLVDYPNGATWGYDAWAFGTNCVGHGEQPQDCILFDSNGTCCQAQVIPGQIDFDGFQYDFAPAQLLLSFIAAGSDAFSKPGHTVTQETDLSLAMVDRDFRLVPTSQPVRTFVEALVWNTDEWSFSASKCVTCWNQDLLRSFGAAFVRATLQTDAGRARFDGKTAPSCTDSSNVALLGVANPILLEGGQVTLNGSPLIGLGREAAHMYFDVQGIPPEKAAKTGK